MMVNTGVMLVVSQQCGLNNFVRKETLVMKQTNKKQKLLTYAALTLVSLLSLGIVKIISEPEVVRSAPTNKSVTFDKNSVPAKNHGPVGGIETLSLSGTGRSDILYTPTAVYQGDFQPVVLGGNRLITIPNTVSSGSGVFLEFYFGVNNLKSVSVTIGHTLIAPNKAMYFMVQVCEFYDQTNPVSASGKSFYFVDNDRPPGTYNFNVADYPAIDFSVQYVLIQYSTWDLAIDPSAGENIYIDSVTAEWYC